MTDQTGRVHEHVEYFPYGDVWRDAKGDADPPNPTARTPNYLFTGKEFDPETGLTYFGARYYDSKLARWPSPDPAFLDQGSRGFSVYHYVAWNPIRATDSDGRMPDWTPQWTAGSQRQNFEFANSPAGIATLELELGILAAPVIGLGCAAAPGVCGALGWFALAGTMTSGQPTLVNVGNIIQHPDMHLFQIGLLLGGVGPAFEGLFEAFSAWRLPRLSLGKLGEEGPSAGPSAASGCPSCSLADASAIKRPALPEEYWLKKEAPTQVQPGTRRLTDQKPSSRSRNEVYERTTHYDEYGRQVGQTHKTSHAGPAAHPNPHHHVRNPQTGERSDPLPGVHPEY